MTAGTAKIDRRHAGIETGAAPLDRVGVDARSTHRRTRSRRSGRASRWRSRRSSPRLSTDGACFGRPMRRTSIQGLPGPVISAAPAVVPFRSAVDRARRDRRGRRDARVGLALDRSARPALRARRSRVHRRARTRVAVNSCTAALHLSLLAAGDRSRATRSITTPLTFCATANVIVHAGATPVFADVDPLT